MGDAVIAVFEKANQLFSLSFTWRITVEEAENLIPSFTLNIHKGGRNGD